MSLHPTFRRRGLSRHIRHVQPHWWLTEHPLDQYIFPEKEEGWYEMEVWMIESDNNERTVLFRKHHETTPTFFLFSWRGSSFNLDHLISLAKELENSDKNYAAQKDSHMTKHVALA